MAYFNYHAKAHSLIISGHCTHAEIIQKHNKISPALILYFDNHSPMPIREYNWQMYIVLLNEYNIKIHNTLT